MEIGNNLSIGLSQRLAVTQKMKLSLKILKMTSEELGQFLEKEKEGNILMSIDRKNGHKVSEYDPYAVGGVEEVSFYEYLYTQIGELTIDKGMREICEYIVDNIDSKGYLSHWVRHPYNQFEFDKGLEIIRSLEPLGVGADDLQGCLLLQLDVNEVFEKVVIEEYLEELAYGDTSKIAKELGIHDEKMKKIIDRIKGLNPIPSRGYCTDDKKVEIVPDAYIKINAKKLEVLMNETIIPKILLEQSELLVYNPKYKKYIEKCRNRAGLIIGCIEQRQATLKKVIEETIQIQESFFYGGELRPLTLMEVGDRLNIHQSTVSRAIKNKYIDTGKGIIKLKKLFAKQFNSKKNNGVCQLITRNQIKDYLHEMISCENKGKPYSDDKLVSIFKIKNIDISRRAIAKYRGEMKIPPSNRRKQGQG